MIDIPVSTIDTGHLITIDPTTGDGTDVGSFGLIGMLGEGITLADLTFDPATGVLYGWRAGLAGDLYTVNLNSGAGAASQAGLLLLSLALLGLGFGYLARMDRGRSISDC